ncbi:hypothetical protein EI545_09490 [Tabrizicola piscis]|uniref:Uncharacterized protein n=1 Tax=Tabrizicola piscis TaxID=2494374 RepID=A0A3S8U619_9RHOB|nr:hypothetical protein [Tabrizicola piscis]AZL59053.1 hypothetical protein EI545_09490 [Tabrizicola piscis]
MTFAPETHRWRQKLTVVIHTPTGEVTGSSVIEVRVSFYGGGQTITGREVAYDLIGEATVVEVLPGKYLVALIGGSEELFARAAKDRFEGMTRGEWLRAIPRQTEPVTLSGDLIPMLVTFDDITKPETVRRVDPKGLAAVFGEGVRLKAVTLEITEEAVTEGRVEGVLGWLNDVWPDRLDGKRFGTTRTQYRFANSLSANSFSTHIIVLDPYNRTLKRRGSLSACRDGAL